MTLEATFKRERGTIHKTAANHTAGEIIQLSDGRAAVVQGLNADALASGETIAVVTEGQFVVSAASATTWSDGDDLYWDASASQAVPPSLALDGDTDFLLGKAIGDKANGESGGMVDLNAGSRYSQLAPIVFEFDHEDLDSHVLIPAEQNPHGLVIEQVYGIVTEQPVGTSEDQLIVTVSDESDNTLATLTTTDTTPDAVGDVIVGTNGLWGASTGDAKPKTVAAGEYVDAAVTQTPAGGTPAGKVKVYVVARPLV